MFIESVVVVEAKLAATATPRTPIANTAIKEIRINLFFIIATVIIDIIRY